MIEDEWQPIATAPYNEPVWTKFHDEDGERNLALLRLNGKLWLSGYLMVYYTPTHWRRHYPW